MFKKIKILAVLMVIPCLGFNVSEMSLEEKVGQLLMVQFHGEVANEEARVLIQETKVGGIIYYTWANSLSSPEQVYRLSYGLQEFAKKNRNPIPLLIAADQEMGLVNRLTNGFTIFPGNKALGSTGDLRLAEQAAYCVGNELKAVGVNMNLAPVVDVNCNPKNPVIGIRSLGETPELVINFGKKLLAGFSKADVITTLKHFPGHGDVTVDSHEDLPVIHKSLEELEKTDLAPFRELSSLADAIMTAHLMVPALDRDNCSTVSEKTHKYLRDKIGFQGLIISDSLVMEGVLKQCQSVDEAAIRTVIAGCDMLILGGRQLIGKRNELNLADIQRIHEALVLATRSGRISEARINDAVTRILKLKGRLKSMGDFDSSSIKTSQHQEIAHEIASRALKVSQRKKINFLDKKIAIFAPDLVKESLCQTDLGKRSDLFFFTNLSPSAMEVENIKQVAKSADVLLFFSYNAWKNPEQISCIQSLIATGKPVALIALRDPQDADLFPQADIVLTTFSPTLSSMEVCLSTILDK